MLNRTFKHAYVIPTFALIALPNIAKAQTFIETFDHPTGTNGQVLFHADPVYLATGASPSGGDKKGNVPYLNGLVIQNNNTAPFAAGGWGLINHDQSGSGYFLYEGTNNGSAPSYAGKFWQSYNLVTVTPNTLYNFSFYLTNSTPRPLSTQNPAVVQPFINGLSLGAGVSAKGYYTDGVNGDGWQKFTFGWNSGSFTTADISLFNQRVTGDGNDFGMDTISLNTASSVPEPGAVALLLAGGLTGAGLFLRRRRKQRQMQTVG